MERLLAQEVKRDQANLLSFSIPVNKFLKISQNALGVNDCVDCFTAFICGFRKRNEDTVGTQEEYLWE